MLEIGDCVRYIGIGAGTVNAHVEREFKGQQRLFAVIDFPHRSMSAQVPIGDPAVQRKLVAPVNRTTLERLLQTIAQPQQTLPRNWDQREEMGNAVLRTGEPADWCSLLGAYAQAETQGISVAAADGEIVEGAIELCAAELSAVTHTSYRDALVTIRRYYDQAATPTPARLTLEPVR
jgi:RNA polymerase-interacting CarD/CdnL/TRCF family regulator